MSLRGVRVALAGHATRSLIVTLGVVVEVERREASRDARFEYELDAVVREYLCGYLAIPPDMVETRQPNGRTPNEELAEQLQLLAGQAEALHGSRQSRVPAQLTTTGNFLREKYGNLHKEAFDFGVK